MIRQSTVDLLRDMRFGGMASELERQLADSASFRELSFEDRLALLIEQTPGIRTLKKGAYAPEKSSVPDDNDIPSSMYRRSGNRAYAPENARKTTRKPTDFSSVKRRKDLCL